MCTFVTALSSPLNFRMVFLPASSNKQHEPIIFVQIIEIPQSLMKIRKFPYFEFDSTSPIRFKLGHTQMF